MKRNPKSILDYKISDLLNFKIPSDARKMLELTGLEWTTVNGIIDNALYKLPSAKQKLQEALQEFNDIFISLNPKTYNR